MMPAERATMDEPLILGRYRLLERLASGGSAEVWRARDEQLDREVAVKRLHPHLVLAAASRKRLEAEARAAARLSHPGIVEIYDVEASGASPVLVMELVEGESLAARILRAGPLPARGAAAVGADVADALFHAHRLGVIHRDVKAANVILGRDGRTRLVDFGIAHSLAAATERLTQTGAVMGTLHAMAPEQLADGPITPRTDLYGLGVVLHEALTGRSPYAVTSPVGLAEAQRAGPPALDDLDPALAALVLACLAYDPNDRPLHAGALADALRSWLEGDAAPAPAMAPVAAPLAIGAETVIQQVPATPAAVGPPPAAGSAVQSPGTRWWPIAALLALGVVGVAALIAFTTGRPPGVGGGPSPTALADSTQTPAPTATPEPAWLARLVRAVERDCGADVAAQFEAAARDMSEREARDAADEVRDECDGNRGKGNGNGKGGRGGGNGNGGRGGGG
jgi:serine/threonine-protein kinase